VPILNVQLGGEAQRPDGTKLPIPPQLALLQRGPIVQVSITVGTAIAQQVLQTGGSVPQPVSGLALIDTGATSTCVDDEAAGQLKLPAIDVVTVASASHSSTQQNVYPIQIEVVGLPIAINAPRAIGAPLRAQGLLLLIGRDVLQHTLLVYNGATGAFSLSI
jgi:predicted aspartyl protease